MHRYKEVSKQVFEIFHCFTPLVEPLSIDEAFMDLSGTAALHRGVPAQTLARLARAVEAELGITVSIGLSYNKFLAKIASDLDKPRGFAVIGQAEARTFLSDKHVSLLWGVGKAMQQTLARDGITLIGQIARLSETELVARYGKIGHRLSLCSRGEDDRSVDPDGEAKSISSEITLDRDLADYESLRPILWRLSESVSRRLKRANTAGIGITMKLKTADFRIITRSRHLSDPTQSAEEMFRAAEPLLKKECDGRPFRLIGIGAHDLVDAGKIAQTDLFRSPDASNGKVEKALDALREKFGEEAVIKGRGFGSKAEGQGPTKR